MIPLLGGVEAGGTKFVCAVGRGPEDLVAGNRIELPTGLEPGRLLSEVTAWFRAREAERGEKLGAIGIASFGPIDLSPDSPRYGFITSTPKPGWSGTDLLSPFHRAFPGVPLGFDTDVNGAALGEGTWGAAAGLEDFVYITIGTGIGAGGMTRGRLLHGLVHPEMGHMRLPRLPGDTFPGVCPFHGDCWEGLCSGPAIRARAGEAADRLPADHPAWAITARTIGLAIANLVCILSPRRVILGGSVRKAGRLGEEAFFRLIRAGIRESLNRYVVSPALEEEIDRFLVPPQLGDNAGAAGAFALARSVLA